jgi:hypothetical protein
MPRVTTQQLAQEIDVIKNNHLAHMAQDIDELKEDLKDTRKEFNNKLDRLDSRIWWILGLTVTTLVTILVSSMAS